MNQSVAISLGSHIAPMIAALQIPAVFVGIDGVIAHANMPAAELLGVGDPALLLQAELMDHVAPDQREAVADFIGGSLAGQITMPNRLKFTLSGCDAELSLSALRSDAQELLGFLCQGTGSEDRGSDALWRLALEKGDHGLWDFDIAAGKMHFSDEWYAMRGRTRDEVGLDTVEHFVDRIHPDDRERVQAGLAQFVAGMDDVYSIEYRERHKSGSYIWILSRGRILSRDEDGVAQRVIGTDTDITSIKSSERRLTALTDSELRWKVAVLSAEQGVWDRNIATGEHFLSESWYLVRGHHPDDEIDTSQAGWQARVHPDDLPQVQAEIERNMRGDTDIVNYQYRYRGPADQWIWILSRGRVVERDAHGNVQRVIGTDTDITELKKSETERAILADRLRMAIEGADLGIWDLDVAAEVMTWDSRLCQMYGLSPTEGKLNLTEWLSRIHPEDIDHVLEVSKAALAKKQGFSIDFRANRPDGETVYLRTKAGYYEDATGKVSYIGINQDISEDHRRTTELEQARAQMEYEARHDALTGLANRRSIDEFSRTTLDSGRNAVLHIDLDHFKQINDTLGHAAGDTVLRHLAQLLMHHCPANGLVARVGGDEFVMLLPDAPSKAELAQLAEVLIGQLMEPIAYQGQLCRVGASIGIAVGQGKACSGRSLFINADLALYEAKNEGRNRFCFYADGMLAKATTRKEMSDALLAGMERGEIICHYQPQFDAPTLRLAGVEVLARWQRPGHDLIMPDIFLPLAEEMGHLARFDELILEKAVRDLDRWDRAGIHVPRLSVNVSAKRLRDPALLDRLDQMQLPCDRLSFELLESTFLDSQDTVLAANIDAIKARGIELEIDDFGTGHASIVGLQQVAPRRLKIDRGLIQPIVQSETQRRLIRTIIEIGRMQEAEVVAEGVETPDHVTVLREMGCDYLQGYSLARPMDARSFAQFLEALDRNGGRVTPQMP